MELRKELYSAYDAKKSAPGRQGERVAATGPLPRIIYVDPSGCCVISGLRLLSLEYIAKHGRRIHRLEKSSYIPLFQRGAEEDFDLSSLEISSRGNN